MRNFKLTGVLTVASAAKYSGVTKVAVHDWIKRGYISAYDFKDSDGRSLNKLLVDKADLDRYLSDRARRCSV
jgi:excisionase family DNA binding protein